jgi:hypothetical protein
MVEIGRKQVERLRRRHADVEKVQAVSEDE